MKNYFSIAEQGVESAGSPPLSGQFRKFIFMIPKAKHILVGYNYHQY